jgi:hypothetical protein
MKETVMKIQIGNQELSFDAVSLTSTASKFPDLLLIAGGKMETPGKKAKFKIDFKDNGSSLKKWNSQTDYGEINGTIFGNMFEAALITKDQISGNFELKVEINGKAVEPSSGFPIDAGNMKGQAVEYEDGAGASCVVGFLVIL